MNIFEQATRTKLRFDSSRGQLTTEDLWNLPLSKGPINLNDLAKQVNRELKNAEEEDFVGGKVSNTDVKNKLRLDILKHIIDVRLEEVAVKETVAKRAEDIKVLTEILQEKEHNSLKDLSAEELRKRIEELQK